MGTAIRMGIAVLASLAWTGPALSETKATQADKDRAALQAFPEVNRAVRDVAPIVDRAARNHAEQSAQRATHGQAQVTSRDRPQSSPIASAAHDRGAIDVVTPQTRQDAARISQAAGPGYTVIHEKPARPAPGAQGPSADIHTVYRNGEQVKSSAKAPRASGEHVHIQPEFNKRLHEAAKPPRDNPRPSSGRSGSGSGGGVQ